MEKKLSRIFMSMLLIINIGNIALAKVNDSSSNIEIILFKQPEPASQNIYFSNNTNDKATAKFVSYYNASDFALTNIVLEAITATNDSTAEHNTVQKALLTLLNNTSLLGESTAEIEHINLLRTSEKNLNSITKKLADANKEIIFHIAWQQPQYSTTSIILDGSELENEDINGNYKNSNAIITVKNNNYPEIEITANIRSESKSLNLHLLKKISKKQINFLDNPYFGALVLVN